MASTFKLDDIQSALDDFKNGAFLLVVDDMDRENEGDLIIAGSKVTTAQMAFLIKHSSGFVCACLTEERLDQLSLPMMLAENTDPHRTAYAVTVDYKQGTSTGISAHDRALTARKLADPSCTSVDFSRPGHVVPLRAKAGGVLQRRGHTEASVDLCKLTDLPPVGVICELVKPDDPEGNMARRDDCYRFAQQHHIKMISIEQIEEYRRKMQC